MSSNDEYVKMLFSEMNKTTQKTKKDVVEKNDYCYCGKNYIHGVKIDNNNKNTQIFCNDCGYEYPSDNRVEQDWNIYTDSSTGVKNTSNIRCSQWNDPNNPYDKGVAMQWPKGFTTTFVGKEGKSITYDMSRLNVRYIPHNQKAFYHVTSLFKQASIILGHDSFIKIASDIWYCITQQNVVTRAGVRMGLIANCMKYACTLKGVPRDNTEIARAFSIEPKIITKGNKVFKEILTGTKMEHILYHDVEEDSKFRRHCQDLNLPFKVHIRCKELYNKHDDELSSIAPKSRVAGILAWVVLVELKLSQPNKHKICKQVDVCGPTLQRVTKILKSVEEK